MKLGERIYTSITEVKYYRELFDDIESFSFRNEMFHSLPKKSLALIHVKYITQFLFHSDMYIQFCIFKLCDILFDNLYIYDMLLSFLI